MKNDRMKCSGQIKDVKLLESEKSVKRDRDIAYLMELKTESLLFLIIRKQV